jgi:hypothetical protein
VIAAASGDAQTRSTGRPTVDLGHSRYLVFIKQISRGKFSDQHFKVIAVNLTDTLPSALDTALFGYAQIDRSSGSCLTFVRHHVIRSRPEVHPVRPGQSDSELQSQRFTPAPEGDVDVLSHTRQIHQERDSLYPQIPDATKRNVPGDPSTIVQERPLSTRSMSSGSTTGSSVERLIQRPTTCCVADFRDRAAPDDETSFVGCCSATERQQLARSWRTTGRNREDSKETKDGAAAHAILPWRITVRMIHNMKASPALDESF